MQDSHIWAAKRWIVSGSPALMPSTAATSPAKAKMMNEVLRFTT